MAFKDHVKKPARNNQSRMLGGAALEVIEFKEDKATGDVTVIGKLLVDAINLPAGAEIEMKFDPEYAADNLDHISTGQSKTPGSILLCENVVAGKTEGEYVARWVTTARSAAKSQIADHLHQNINVEHALVAPPVISFANPNPDNKEPHYIHMGVNAEAGWMKTRGGKNVQYSRDWMRERLAQVPAAQLKQVRVSSMVVNPSTSAAVSSLEDIRSELDICLATEEGAAIPGAIAILRVVDETGQAETSMARLPYLKDTKGYQPIQEFITAFEGRKFIRGLENDVLEQMLQSGEWKAEVIQAFDVPYLGKSLEAIIKDVRDFPLPEANPEDTTVNAGNKMMSYVVTYGRSTGSGPMNAISAVVATGPTESGVPFFTNHPLRLDGRHTGPLAYQPTNILQPAKPKSEEEAAEEANVDNADHAGQAGEDDTSFDAQDFVIDGATAADGTPGSSQQAPAAESEQQAEVQTRTSPSPRQRR